MISSDVSEGRSVSVLSVNEFGSETSSNYPEYGGNTFLQNAGKIWYSTLDGNAQGRG